MTDPQGAPQYERGQGRYTNYISMGAATEAKREWLEKLGFDPAWSSEGIQRIGNMKPEEKALARNISDHFKTGPGAAAVHKLLDGEGHNILIIEGEEMEDTEVSGLSYLCSEIINDRQPQIDKYVVLNWFCGVRENEYDCVETMLRSLLGQLTNRFTEPLLHYPPTEFNDLISTLWQEILTMLLSTDVICIIDHVQRYNDPAEREAMQEALDTLIAITDHTGAATTTEHSFRLLMTTTKDVAMIRGHFLNETAMPKYVLPKKVVEEAQIKAEEETRGRSTPRPSSVVVGR